MPKLNDTHLTERLRKRLAELLAGQEVAVRDIAAVLTAEQVAALDEKWLHQQSLRVQFRAATKTQQVALGMHTKREMRIAALRSALADAELMEVAAWDKLMRTQEVRQARIYFDALNQAERDGKDAQAARNWANNELTRAGLGRMDGGAVKRMNMRDREVRDMEDALRARFRAEMTAEQREQLELSEQHEADKVRRSRRGQ